MSYRFTWLTTLFMSAFLLSGCCTSYILDRSGRVSLQIKEIQVERSEKEITLTYTGNIRTEYFPGIASDDTESTILTLSFPLDHEPENAVYFTEEYRIETFDQVPRFYLSPYSLYSTQLGQWQIHPDDIPLTAEPHISCNHLAMRQLAIPLTVTQDGESVKVKGYYGATGDGITDLFPENNELFLPERSNGYLWWQICLCPVPLAIDIALLPLQILTIALIGI
ncbi:MAG: hypothetical protein E7053_09750 [Lentisphaerae bacterium]|nr:hypothetical protein [Lentisphaerota bacterium]